LAERLSRLTAHDNPGFRSCGGERLPQRARPSKHFRSTQHPIVTSLERGKNWSWCYVDEFMMELG